MFTEQLVGKFIALPALVFPTVSLHGNNGV